MESKKSNTVKSDHLNSATRQFLNSCSDTDSKDRIERIQGETWIGYQNAKTIIDGIQNLIDRPRVTRMHSMLICAMTDNGKSSIRRRVAMKNQGSNTGCKEIMPVVSIQLTANPDERALFNRILKAMKRPTYMTGRVDFICEQVITEMENLKVRLLMIDEVQHIDRMPYRKQRIMLDTIKYLTNELSLPIAAFGTEESLNVFSSDPQVNNRFKRRFLPKWQPDDNFRSLLATFEQFLPLKEPSILYDKVFSDQIFYRTNGTIGEISTLISLAAVEAITSGSEKITPEIIAAVNMDTANETDEE